MTFANFAARITSGFALAAMAVAAPAHAAPAHAAPAHAAPANVSPTQAGGAKGEAALAKLLEGREPGQPVACISLFTARDMEVIDKTAIVYGRGTTIFVNRPSNPLALRADNVMVSSPTGDQLCNLDIIHMRDSTSHMNTGFVGLERFVPWTKVAKPVAVR